MCDDDKPGSLEAYKFTSLHGVCDDDKPGSLEGCTLYMTMISLEVWKSTS